MVNPLLAGWNGYIDRISVLADSPSINYRQIAVILTWLHLGFDVYLQQRQHACYSRPQPPPKLKEHIPLDKFQKAQAYGKDKNRFQLYKMVWDHAIALYMLQSRFLVQTWELAGTLQAKAGFGSQYIIPQSLLWMVFLMAPSAILSVPWDWYYDFHLEERHAFNKKTPTIFFTDIVKTWGVFLALLLPIFAGMLKVIELFGKNFVPFLVGFMIIVQLVAQLIYPTFIQPLFNKLTPLPTGELRNKVESLAGSLDFPLKHLYVIDGSKRSSHSNAYFYGLPWSKHIVIFDTLIDKQTTPEIEAVLGHELGHWYFSHPTKMMAVAQLQVFLTFTIFSIFIHNQALYASFGFDPRLALTSAGGGAQPIMIGLQLFTLLQDPIGVVEKFLMNAQTRRFEYQADEFAVRLGRKQELQQALIKLHVDNLSSPHNDKLFSLYHHSHPTLPERLLAMDQAKAGQPLKLKNVAKKEL